MQILQALIFNSKNGIYLTADEAQILREDMAVGKAVCICLCNYTRTLLVVFSPGIKNCHKQDACAN